LITRLSGWFYSSTPSFALIGFMTITPKSQTIERGVFDRLRLILGFAIGRRCLLGAQYHQLSCKTNWPANLQGHADQSRRAVHPFSMIVIVGAANAVNMTDGLTVWPSCP
jgi:phospho-N-acetylmuramoyl-pentapeptide-transferase